ncbi:CYTH domain-containing protein [Jeotgalibaca sp. MA1X17-3]|uniref:CYTH domain-containing protein n=1 Tax=Jeotgalibaca sp. MA1X17-3 TaxID=2908211 RepID=UPI001F215696|nr:CYTH domain-containing protein [Jeotgalibaca sp. MA1X17-3]UJF15155.1 CYTH domain-containing protein [Jeotgalibaca sp. MA1X17-3]
MSQQIEKEFKNLLTKEEYEELLANLQLNENEAIQQTNIYFDTTTQQLKNQNMGLRIRLFDDYGELTLKSPISENEQLETTDELNLETATVMADKGIITLEGHVADKLAEFGIKISELEPIGKLSTLRYTFPGEGGMYFLDESYYQDQKDYELEFETEDVESGKFQFEQFLAKHQIKKRKAIKKIARMLNYPNK